MATTVNLGKRTSPRELRDKLGLTQAQLAQRLHVSTRTVVRWEAGLFRMHYVYRDRLLQMVRDLGLDPLEVLR
jgi:DNA-binding transcriptional regulator YiaG